MKFLPINWFIFLWVSIPFALLWHKNLSSLAWPMRLFQIPILSSSIIYSNCPPLYYSLWQAKTCNSLIVHCLCFFLWFYTCSSSTVPCPSHLPHVCWPDKLLFMLQDSIQRLFSRCFPSPFWVPTPQDLAPDWVNHLSHYWLFVELSGNWPGSSNRSYHSLRSPCYPLLSPLSSLALSTVADVQWGLSAYLWNKWIKLQRRQSLLFELHSSLSNFFFTLSPALGTPNPYAAHCRNLPRSTIIATAQASNFSLSSLPNLTNLASQSSLLDLR